MSFKLDLINPEFVKENCFPIKINKFREARIFYLAFSNYETLWFLLILSDCAFLFLILSPTWWDVDQ